VVLKSAAASRAVVILFGRSAEPANFHRPSRPGKTDQSPLSALNCAATNRVEPAFA
jgi:hypothetical protein